MSRFSIRDILWLMVVIGLGIALYIEWSNAAPLKHDLTQMNRRHKALETQVQAQGFVICVVDDLNGKFCGIQLLHMPELQTVDDSLTNRYR